MESYQAALGSLQSFYSYLSGTISSFNTLATQCIQNLV